MQLWRTKSEYATLMVVDEGRKRVILIAACISRSPEVDAVGRQKFSGIRVRDFRRNCSGGKNHGENRFPLAGQVIAKVYQCECDGISL